MTCIHDDTVADLSVVYPPIPPNLKPVFKRDLLPEIWPIVLSHLREPIPAPLSRPSRGALTQPHLAVAMRVCKFWYKICEKWLYTNVVTDRFAEWASDVMCSSGPRKRFKLTKSLRIEYLPKGQEPTYKQLVKNCLCNGVSLWIYVGMEAKEAQRLAIGQARQEIEDLSDALYDLRERRMARVLPKLETIAVDSIYAREDDVWSRYEDSWPDYSASEPIQKCTSLFSDWLASGNLRHLCTRDSSGPLCIEFTTTAKGGGPGGYPVNYTRTLHFNNQADQLALPLGGKIRWVSDASPGDDMAQLLLALGRCCGHLNRSRVPMIEQLKSVGRHFESDKADVDIYCSTANYGPKMFDTELVGYGLNAIPNKSGGRQKFTSRSLGEKEQSAMVATLETNAQKFFRSKSGMQDEIRWHTSQSTPRCEACGSGVPV